MEHRDLVVADYWVVDDGWDWGRLIEFLSAEVLERL